MGWKEVRSEFCVMDTFYGKPNALGWDLGGRRGGRPWLDWRIQHPQSSWNSQGRAPSWGYRAHRRKGNPRPKKVLIGPIPKLWADKDRAHPESLQSLAAEELRGAGRRSRLGVRAAGARSAKAEQPRR